MIKGFTLFKCTECGKRFFAPDIELGATCLSTPMKCPKCGSNRTRPSRLVAIIRIKRFGKKRKLIKTDRILSYQS